MKMPVFIALCLFQATNLNRDSHRCVEAVDEGTSSAEVKRSVASHDDEEVLSSAAHDESPLRSANYCI